MDWCYFLSVLMIVSIGNTLFFDGNIRELTMMYNEKGELEAAPFSPSSKFWFGSDEKGRDLFQLIIEGAKWTVGASVIIAILRVIVGGVWACFLVCIANGLFQLYHLF